MKTVRTSAIFFLAIMVLLAGRSSATAAPTIKDIRFESPTTTADRVIFEMNGPHIPTGKALPGDNPRIYFDFPNTIPANKIKNRMPVNGNFVKQIRYAYHKGTESKTRVVFDLVANQKMDFRQDFDKDTNTLVITLYLAGTEPEPAVAPAPKQEAPAVETAPEPTKAAMAAPESTPPAPAAKEEGKSMQQMEEVNITAAPEAEEMKPEPEPQVPPQAQELIPGRTEPLPETAPEEATISEPEAEQPVMTSESKTETESAQPEEASQIASLPPSTKTTEMPSGSTEEATVIQPMSEIGYQEPAVDETAPVLQSIEFDPKSNRGEMISFKLNGFHPPVVFGIEEDVPRIVCFFKNATAGPNLKDMISTNGRYVKNIRIGKYQNPDNIRVVLELVPGNNYDLQQIFFKDDKVFMMIINKAGKQISTQSN